MDLSELIQRIRSLVAESAATMNERKKTKQHLSFAYNHGRKTAFEKCLELLNQVEEDGSR